MANRHSSTPPRSTQDKPFSQAQAKAFTALLKVLMSPDDFDQLSEYSEHTRTPLHIVASASLRDCVDVMVKAHWELWTEGMQKNDRAEQRAEKRRDEDRYLAKLEIDLEPQSSLL